jgi:hypothetical protein
MKFSLIAFLFLWSRLSDQTVELLPDFTFTQLNGKMLSYADLPKENGKYTIIVYSDAVCDNCQAYFAFFLQEANRYANSRVLWVCPEIDPEKMRAFLKQYLGASSFPNLYALIDTQKSFNAWFGTDEKPLILIYDDLGRFVKLYRQSDWEQR